MPKQDTPSPRAGERIAKLLARAGVASRREVERMIADGRVALNGVALDTPATVLASLAGITVDGEQVAPPEPTRLFVYHKPVGLLVTERDPAGRPTIYDKLPEELPRVVPVGRLDLATEGLLLLTTDGGLKRQLELPATGVERTYRARAYGPVTQAQLEDLIDGVEIEGMRYGKIDANLERRTGANGWIEMTLTEGKNREVRRVLEYLGLEVSRLIRTRYGPFVLGELKPGEVGEILQHDLVAFRKTLKGADGAASGAASGGAMGLVSAPAMARPAAADPAATGDRPRPRPARPVPRDGSERRTTFASRPAEHPVPNRERPADRRDARPSAAAAPRGRPARTGGDRDERATAGITAGSDRRVRPAAEREERPRSFGDRTRTAAGARPARSYDGRARARPEASRSDRTAVNDDQRRRRDDRGRPDRAATPGRAANAPSAEREPPRTDRATRPTRGPAATPRPAGAPRRSGTAAAGPAHSKEAGGNRPTRGPAGGRGKPQDPRRPKAPPRGKPPGGGR